jgi:hypothetical protein
MKCSYRNCDKEILILKKFDTLKKYCCSKHQRNEKKYRQREKFSKVIELNVKEIFI